MYDCVVDFKKCLQNCQKTKTKEIFMNTDMGSTTTI